MASLCYVTVTVCASRQSPNSSTLSANNPSALSANMPSSASVQQFAPISNEHRIHSL